MFRGTNSSRKKLKAPDATGLKRKNYQPFIYIPSLLFLSHSLGYISWKE